MTNQLSEPFSQIFTDRVEADWAFDLLRDAARRLRVQGAYDPRLALTLSQRGGRYFLRLNFGGWLVLGFRGPGYAPERVDMALLAGRVAWDERFDAVSFERKEGEPEVRGYSLPLSRVRPLTSDLRRAFEETLDFIAVKFENWRRATHWKQHNPEIIEALFNAERRERLFAGDLTDLELRYERHFTAFGQVIAEEEVGYGVEEAVVDEPDVLENVEEPRMKTEPAFSERAFELLSGLHQSPEKAFYDAHKQEFQAQVISPFQSLMKQVAERLPAQISSYMETEKRIFSRIPKNDYGQGGAWEFYWGAFYPKGGKRTADAQLSMWMDYQRFEFGFYIGEYGKQPRQRFLRNCQENYEALVMLLSPVFSGEKVVFGQRDKLTVNPDGTITGEYDLTWQEWLANPEIVDFDASVTFTAQQILAFSRNELVNKIVDTYTRFFPLILLTIEDNPLPAIEKYLQTHFSAKAGIPQPSFQPAVQTQPALSTELPIATIAAETGFDEADLARWVRAIERKGQAVLYGPPGTGKTFLAHKLAAHLIGGGDGFSELVQFHPAYAYEDFIQGIRPRSEDGQLRYPLEPGRFLDFCRRAEQRRDTCVLIIDEINRANLSRVFGELMYLLEYRTESAPLAGGGRLRIPANVRLIGTMNTADRSIALVDHALRRRFAFIRLWPNFEALRRYHQQTGFPVEKLVELLASLNQHIGDPHYEVGITFFLRPNLVADLPDIWQMEIEPYLEEYFFSQPDKLEEFRWPAIAPGFYHQ